MICIKKSVVVSLCLLLLLLSSAPVSCQDDPFSAAEDVDQSVAEEMEWLQAETFVITASKILESFLLNLLRCSLEAIWGKTT